MNTHVHHIEGWRANPGRRTGHARLRQLGIPTEYRPRTIVLEADGDELELILDDDVLRSLVRTLVAELI